MVVAATFLTSLEKLVAQSPAAAELLNATAFLVPDAIPEEIFTEGAAEFGPVVRAAGLGPVEMGRGDCAALRGTVR